jgi:outer membrane lipoprotein-sorting protein
MNPEQQDLRLLDDLGEQFARAERDAGTPRPRGVLWRLRAGRALRGPLLAGLLLLVTASGVALATGVVSLPPAKPLPQAIQDAASAPPLDGVSARIEFTNRLIDNTGVTRGADPVISGATGRLWASNNGDLRLELQSSGGSGDAQLLIHGDSFWLYHAAANTVYQGTLPPLHKDQADKPGEWPPTLTAIRRALATVSQYANLSDAQPSNVAGRPAYTLRLEPKQHGGLVGGAEIAWDAVNGAPLRAALYAKAMSDPVLEIKATSIDFGAVPASTFDIPKPADATVVDLSTQSAADGEGSQSTDGAEQHPAEVTGLADVTSHVGFKVTAPDTLSGMPRSEVRLVGGSDHPGALVTYGEGLDGIAVLETAAPNDSGRPASADGDHRGLSLPSVDINGVQGQKLATPLGTVITFTRDGVRYVVLGSVISSTAEAAAREL